MAIGEKRHLSIFSKSNQTINRLSVKRDQSWVDLKFYQYTSASTFVPMTMRFATPSMSINGSSRIIIYNSGVTLQIVASLTDDARGVIYDRSMFIAQATSDNYST